MSLPTHSLVCLGQLFGETSFYLTCAMTLAAFNISKAKVTLLDGTRMDVEPKVEFVSSFVTCVYVLKAYLETYIHAHSQPCPFQCEILPRSEQAAAFLRLLEA